PTLALIRALTELNQFLPAVTRSEEGILYSQTGAHDVLALWLRNEELDRHLYLTPDPMSGRVHLSEYICPKHEDLRDDIEFCLRRLAAAGIDTYVLDQTRPDIGLPVVKIIAPGLRHIWARHAPGR